MRSPKQAIRLPSSTALALALAALLVSPLARAQALDDARARADALFREGQQLLTAGQVAAACSKLEESQRLDPKLGRLLNLAYCHEQLGLTATAWSEYNQAAALALQTAQAERETFARTQAGELARKLSFVRLDLAAAAEVSDVTIDGKPLGHDQWAVPFPIDPGLHVMTFGAQGYKTREQTVTIAAPGTTKVAVVPLDSETPEAAPAPPPAAAALPVLSPVEPPRSSGTTRVVGWVVGGAGIAALGAGTAFALNAMSLKSQADPSCPQHACSPHGMSLIDEAKTNAWIATAGFGAGVVGVGVGAWLVLRVPSNSAPTQVAPYIAPDRAGVAWRGVW
jgi:hypothetical protein